MFSLGPTRLVAPLISAFSRRSGVFQCLSSRYICDKALLKLDIYEKERNKFSRRLKDVDDFWLRFLSLLDSGQIFHEDLKMAWFLAEEQHLEAAKKASERYLEGKKNVSFGSFRYGSTVMRTCYFLKKPDTALEIFNSPIRAWLDEAMSIMILMDLLIEQGNPQDAVAVHEEMERIEWNFVLRNPIIAVLHAVALYKTETPEAMEKADKLSKKLLIGPQYRNKVCYTLGALALKLKNPQKALEFVSREPSQSEVSWNVKIQAHAMLSDWEAVKKELKLGGRYNLFEDTRESITALNVNGNNNLHLPTGSAKKSVDQEVSSMSFEENKDALPIRRKLNFM